MSKYKELLDVISQCTDDESVNGARAMVQAYRIQRGGHNVALQAEITELSLLIIEKEQELNQL